MTYEEAIKKLKTNNSVGERLIEIHEALIRKQQEKQSICWLCEIKFTDYTWHKIVRVAFRDTVIIDDKDNLLKYKISRVG